MIMVTLTPKSERERKKMSLYRGCDLLAKKKKLSMSATLPNKDKHDVARFKLYINSNLSTILLLLLLLGCGDGGGEGGYG